MYIYNRYGSDFLSDWKTSGKTDHDLCFIPAFALKSGFFFGRRESSVTGGEFWESFLC